MDKRVNIDYLCVIRREVNNTLFEKIDIPQSTELVTTLQGMIENDNMTVLDMQAQMNIAYPKEEQGFINYISPYPYDSAFVEGASFPPSLTYDEYKDDLSGYAEYYTEAYEKAHKSQMDDNQEDYAKGLSDYIEEKIVERRKSLKKDYLSKARRFIMAKNYKRTLEEAKDKAGIIKMYSTDTVGWSDFTYKVTDDITIKIDTNFGFGSSSYFDLCLKYKGIDVLPYSYVVKYYYANRRDIIRYTRRYHPTRDSWNLAFDYVERTANLASDDGERFICNNILGEVRQMVDGLVEMLDDPKLYMDGLANQAGERTTANFLSVRNMTTDEKKQLAVYPQEMTMLVKAEKVTGALDFLENLNKLSETIPEIDDAIDSIKSMAQGIVPDIKIMITSLMTEIVSLKYKKDEVEIRLDDLRSLAKPHEKRIDDLFEDRKKDNIYLIRSTIENEYASDNKEFSEIKKMIDDTRIELNDINEELSMRESFRSELASCIIRVKDAGLATDDEVAA